MTAKNRHRSSDKSAASSQDDAAKKSQASSGAPRAAGPGPQGPQGPQGPRTRSCLGLLMSTVFYVALMGAVGFAAFYLQKAVEEMRETSARRNADVGTKLDDVVLQVGVRERLSVGGGRDV